MNCMICSNEVEAERIQVLGYTELCSECARKANVPRKKGFMSFEHKTAPTICVVSADYYDTEWKKYNPSFGRGSGVHAMSPRLAGTA
jgi:hypothetical protein